MVGNSCYDGWRGDNAADREFGGYGKMAGIKIVFRTGVDSQNTGANDWKDLIVEVLFTFEPKRNVELSGIDGVRQVGIRLETVEFTVEEQSEGASTAGMLDLVIHHELNGWEKMRPLASCFLDEFA